MSLIVNGRCPRLRLSEMLVAALRAAPGNSLGPWSALGHVLAPAAHMAGCPQPPQPGCLGWVVSLKPKGRQLDAWSGHKPGVRAQSPFGAQTEDRQSGFLTPVSPSLPFPHAEDKKL